MLKNDEKSELQILISKIDSSKGKIELFELLEETILEYFKLLIRENNDLDSETSEEEIDVYYFMEENKFSVIDYRASSKECLVNRSFYYDNLFKLCSLNLRHLLLNYERFPVIYVLILANDLDGSNIKDEVKLFTKNYVLPEILKLFYEKILSFSNNEAEFVKDFLRGELLAMLFSKLFEILESSIENQLMDLNKKQLESFFTKISSDKQDFISNKSFKDFILFKNNLIKDMHTKEVFFEKVKTLSEFNVLQPIDFVKIINDLFVESDQPFNSKLDFSMLTSAMFIPISKFFKVYYDYDYKDRIIFKEKVKDLNENLNNFSDTIKEMDFKFYKRYQITWESYLRIFNELLKK
ncbi:MAG: hypothetical protein HXM94_00515 [Parvimonas micra]|uniref:Uncharacterized protein n=1 Tax=Parvimonas micra TaxID=33033 RepID=A0A930E351_9FIRM|nr:hypothetical protein [Parvimonas micra]MBF1306256.1 hypothetical protein [Parvimonas micra]